MTKGWKLESTRHSLARKGIKTGQKKSLFPLPYKSLKETCPETATPEFRKQWVNLIKGLTDEEFERWRYSIYLKPNYTENYKATSDDRTRETWAKDKAFDDKINRSEVEESILEDD